MERLENDRSLGLPDDIGTGTVAMPKSLAPAQRTSPDRRAYKSEFERVFGSGGLHGRSLDRGALR